MSGWGLGWFGGGAQKKRDAPKKAILGLRQQLEMLQKRERHIESQVEEQDAIARKNVNSNKNAARAALKRKKQHEHSLQQTQAQIATLEQQVYSIESANINYETLQVMERAGQAMKQIHGGLTMDKVDNTMDELREQHALGEEIGEAITRVPIGGEIDETELDEELQDMEQEELDKTMLGAGPTPVADRLPSVANGEIKASKGKNREEEDEEAELRKLQAEMAM